MLKNIVPLLRKIAYRQDLTADECHHLAAVITDNDFITDPDNSDGMYLLALTFGIMAKGPTADELYGFLLSLMDRSVSLTCALPPENIIDVSGTGGDLVKSFNVGSAAAVVLAAGGLYVAKQATRSYTGFSGSADVFAELGLDAFHIKQAEVIACLEATKLTAFHTPSLANTFANRMSFLSKLANIGLAYPTPWHLLSWVYSPVKMDSRLYGVFDPRFLRPTLELFKKLGYKRVMVVHGEDGLDEISNIGDTRIVELNDGAISEWILRPEDCEIKRACKADIETISHDQANLLADPKTSLSMKEEIRALARENNITTFFRVLYGLEHGAKRDIVLMNAAAGFLLCNKVRDLSAGVRLAASLIDEGATIHTLRNVATFFHSNERLREREANLRRLSPV